MMVPVEGPIGMPLLGHLGCVLGQHQYVSEVMVLQHCKLTGRAQKTRLLAQWCSWKVVTRPGYLDEEIKLSVDSMDIVDTLRKDKSFPGRKRWKGGKMADIQSDSEKKKKFFFLDFPLNWPLEYSGQLTVITILSSRSGGTQVIHSHSHQKLILRAHHSSSYILTAPDI